MPVSEPRRLPAEGPPPPPASVPAGPRVLTELRKSPPVTGVSQAAPAWTRDRLGPVKLSILMPAYNEERTVAWVIDEILNSDYPCEIELIVVDDGSTDQTPVLLAGIADIRVRVLRHPVN